MTGFSEPKNSYEKPVELGAKPPSTPMVVHGGINEVRWQLGYLPLPISKAIDYLREKGRKAARLLLGGGKKGK